MLWTLFGWSFLALAHASSSLDTAKVCTYLYAEYPSYLVFNPTSPDALKTLSNASEWNSINTEYWNFQNAQEYQSACTFMPANAAMVATAVQALLQYPDVPFALKSGGHMPGPGFSSTDGGVLISFEPNLASTVRTDDGKHFIIEPGARWQSVYEVTEQTNQIVVGGRLGHIGAGGLTLGGGLSYLSAQYGLASDNIDQFEVVLANGTATNASRSEHPELWWALRGGSNQFAIVTRMWSQAHPAGTDGKIWGGIRAYSPDKRQALFEAISKFNANQTDPKAAIIATFQFGLPANLLDAITGPIFFFFYDAATPPQNGVFADFDAIEPLLDDTATQSPSQLAAVTKGAEGTPGLGNSFRAATFPAFANISQQTEFLSYMWDAAYEQSFGDSLTNLDVQLLGIDIQPITTAVLQASQAQGGNIMGLNPENGARVWVENDLVWLNPLCDQKCPQYSQTLMDKITTHHKATYPGVPPAQYKTGDIDFVNYNPVYLNDADRTQDIFSTYGADNVARLQRIKAEYDPHGFFTTRQGGFKLPKQ